MSASGYLAPEALSRREILQKAASRSAPPRSQWFEEQSPGSWIARAENLNAMDHLWAPWRLAYVAADKPPALGDECFICRGLAESDDRRNLIAYRGARSVVVLNRFPYNNGHLLVAPRAHKAGLDDLDPDELLDVMETLRRMVRVLGALMRPDGFNVGLNLGRAA